MIEGIEYLAFRLLQGITHILSYRLATRKGAFLGAAVFHLTGFRKKITLENLAHAFPELSENERKRIALGAYRNYGIALLQMLWAGGQSEEVLRSTVRIPDRSLIDRHLNSGKGFILLSGHYGCWEFLVQGLRLQLGKPVNPIVQRQRNVRIDRLVDATRSRFGNITIPMGSSSAKETLKTLREGGIVAMLGDQSGPRESVVVEFFGRPAATHRGAAAFSLRTGAPILMVFLLRQQDGIYNAVFEEVNRSGLEGYSDANVEELTRRHTAILERYIRLHPDHWLWMHKRWKHTGYYESHQRVEAGIA